MVESSASAKKRGLGMGLSALLGSEAGGEGGVEIDPSAVQTVPIEFLAPSPLQPRRRFDEDELRALADSIRSRGVLQPLVVRPVPSGAVGYEIIAGERRWRAAQQVGLHQLPVIVRELGDLEVLEVALIENLQREDLSPIEEARAYRRLIDEFGHTQDALADSVGKSRSHVANMMRLLKLPDEVLGMVEAGELSAGHARAILSAEDPLKLARDIVARSLTVRDTEALGQGRRMVNKSMASGRTERDPNIVACEEEIASRLGLEVKIQPKRKGGTLTIRYSGLDQLEAVLSRLRG